MTTPNTIPGEGVTLKMKISAVFTEIGLVTEIDGPAVLIAPIDTTHLTSTVHTRRPSKLPNPDKLTFKMWFDPNDTAMQVLIANRTNVPGTTDEFNLVFPDANTTHALADFMGFFTSFKPNGMKIEENVGADVELQLVSLITWTPGVP